MKALFSLAVGLMWLGTGCGLFLVNGPEGPPPTVWAADTCAILVPTLALTSIGLDDIALGAAIDSGRKDLERLEPASGGGPMHDRITDDLETIARAITDLAADEASEGELDAEWGRLREGFLAKLRERVADLPSEERLAFRESCAPVLATGS
jgi:hypothetical protein